MSIMKEFKEFAVKGNMIDMAVGVIIGGAFGKIVSSLLSDVLMPPIGLLIGKVDFSSLFISLNGQQYASLVAAKAAGAPTINYGVFLNTMIDFVSGGFVVFIVIKQINRLKRQEPAAAPTTKACPECVSSIPLTAKRCAYCASPIAATALAEG